MSERQRDGFVLFSETKRRSPNAPEYTGKGTIDAATLDYIVQCWRAGKSPDLELVGWKKMPKNGGNPFLSIAVNIPYTVRREREERGGDRDERRDERRDDRRESRARDDDDGFPGNDRRDPPRQPPRREERQSSFPDDDIPF